MTTKTGYELFKADVARLSRWCWEGIVRPVGAALLVVGVSAGVIGLCALITGKINRLELENAALRVCVESLTKEQGPGLYWHSGTNIIPVWHGGFNGADVVMSICTNGAAWNNTNSFFYAPQLFKLEVKP